MKIKTKLVLLFTMITVSSLLVTGIISFNNAKKALEDAAYNSLELVNNAYISNITHIIQLRHEQTKEIAGTYLVRHLNPSGPTPDSVISKIQEHIISILEELKVAKTIEVHDELHRATDIEEIDIIDKNGTILSSTNEAVIGKKIPERFIYIVKKEGSWFGGYNYDPETGEMFLNFYQGVLSYKDKKISGIVLLKVRAGILNEISDNQSSLWKSQELLIGHKRNDSITYITSLRNKEEYVRYSETPMTLAVNGNEGKGEMLDYRNKKVLAVWQYNKNTGWGIVSKVDIEDINAPIINLQYLVTIVAFIILIIVILIAFYFADSVAKPIQSLVTTFVKISQGELTPPKVVKGTFEITQLSSIANNTVVFLKGYINKLSKIASSDFSDVNKPIDEKDEIGLSLYEMSVSLKNYHENQQRDLWMEKGINEIIASTKEETNLNELCNNILQHSIPYVNAHIGALYIYDHLESVLLLKGSYALSKKKNFKDKLKIGEGLSGQAVVEQKTKIIKNLPGDFDKINSGFVDITINELVIIPLIFHKLLVGVIEVGSANSFTELQMEFLNRSSDLISAAVSSALDRDLIENLLTDSKISAEQLQEKNIYLEKVQLELSQQIQCLNYSAIVSETDANGNITFVNDLFCEISGYDLWELMGQNHRMLKSGLQPQGIFVGMWKSINKGNTWRGELVNKKKNGEYYWVDTTIMPFKNTSGEIEKYVAIRFDITTQKEQQKLLQEQTEELSTKHDQLEERNVELERHSDILYSQRIQLEDKNKQLIKAREEIEEKAKELELSSTYKSEFLANMSHELRTPLNSILLLSKFLTENNERNLNENQIEYAKIINQSGNNLLELINEILDLSKIEAGKMEIQLSNVLVDEIANRMEDLFLHLAKSKNIKYETIIDKKITKNIVTDQMRLEQVLKNLLSNALKFTAEGSVRLKIYTPTKNTTFNNPLLENEKVIAFEVIDTGIGIPKEKQMLVFAAFQQMDGSIQRNYGGTGLGLTISRKIAELLGGEVQLKSEEGKGSVFTIYIPIDSTKAVEAISTSMDSLTSEIELSDSMEFIEDYLPLEINDDRSNLTPGEKLILVMEDDLNFAKSLKNQLNLLGYKCIIGVSGAKALTYAQEFKPMGIFLDIKLPEKNGWKALDELKNHSETKTIPVYLISSLSVNRWDYKRKKALGYLKKPLHEGQLEKALYKIERVVSDKSKKILIIEDNLEHSKDVINSLQSPYLSFIETYSANDGINTIKNDKIDLVILDLGLPDMSGYDLLQEIKNLKNNELEIVVYTGKNLLNIEEDNIKLFADRLFFKDKISRDELKDEIFSLLHLDNRVNEKNNTDILIDKKVLIVDDDPVNIFSLAKILEAYGIEILKAQNGQKGLEKIEKEEVDMVLMDMMMPVMDGYEASEIARKKWPDLPIIAVTAKTMKGDKEKCLEAGASDYCSKPVDKDQLLSKMIKLFQQK